MESKLLEQAERESSRLHRDHSRYCSLADFSWKLGQYIWSLFAICIVIMVIYFGVVNPLYNVWNYEIPRVLANSIMYAWFPVLMVAILVTVFFRSYKTNENRKSEEIFLLDSEIERAKRNDDDPSKYETLWHPLRILRIRGEIRSLDNYIISIAVLIIVVISILMSYGIYFRTDIPRETMEAVESSNNRQLNEPKAISDQPKMPPGKTDGEGSEDLQVVVVDLPEGQKTGERGQFISEDHYATLVAAFVAYVVPLLIWAYSKVSRKGERKSDLIRAESEMALARYSTSKEQEWADKRYSINERLLGDFYSKAQKQSGNIFLLGVFCIFSGVGISAFTVLHIFGESGKSISQISISGAVGFSLAVLVNFVAYLFIRMNSEISRQNSSFHRRAVNSGDILLANVALSGINNTVKREKALVDLATQIAKRDFQNSKDEGA